MQIENKYIGDDKFKNFLNHYSCPSSLEVVKMKFAGAICSPNLNLRPTDVISSLWEEDKQPRLETKKEAELFFKFFMGLWDEMFTLIKQNKLILSKGDKNNLIAWCNIRYQELEEGFLEGFWGGCADLKLPAYIAQIVDSLSEVAEVYVKLGQRLQNKEDKEIYKTILHTDKTAERAISFIIENSVLPRIDGLQRKVN